MRISYWTGAIFDAIIRIPMLSATVGGVMMGITDFNPGPDYKYAMAIGASLMGGWVFLLLWADREPMERWAGEHAMRYLDHQMIEVQKIRINCEPPIVWISPGNLLTPSMNVPALLYTMCVKQRVRNAIVSVRCKDEMI